MLLKLKWKYAQGEFDTKTVQLIDLPAREVKHEKDAEIAIKDSWNFSFAESGKRNYTPEDVRKFMTQVEYMWDYERCPKIYWKDSVLDYIGMKRDSLDYLFHVGADYNIFNK